MKSLFSGSVAIAAALFAVSLGFNAKPLVAETLLSQPTSTTQQEQELKSQTTSVQAPEKNNALAAADHATNRKPAETSASPLAAPPQTYVATAYTLRGRGASGLGVRVGTIAADPRVLPFGTRVRLEAGQYSGEYLVTDSGSAIKGRKIDVWIPSYREACRFGRRNVKLSVISYGGRRKRMR